MLAFAAVLLLLPSIASAKIKIVESSSKKVPVWLDQSEPEFIITSAVGEDLEMLKQQCLDNVKKRIVESVAQNIQFSTENSIKQASSGTELTEFNDQFTSQLKTQAANIPYVKGVSIAKVADSYWAKRYDTQTKQTSYVYAIRYPFPRLELKKLTREFELKDAEMVAEYKRIESKFDSICSIEEIALLISKTDQLVDYFFDDVRKNAAIAMRANLNALYNGITIETINNTLGSADLQFMLNGRRIATSQRPVLKSTTATQLDYKQTEPMLYSVLYSYEFCELNAPNEISAKFRIGNKSVEHKIFFTVRDQKVVIMPMGEIYLNAGEKSDTLVRNVVLRMNLTTKNVDKFTVRNITLTIPGVVGAVFAEDIEITYDKPGSNKLKAMLDADLEIERDHAGSRNKLILVRGTISGVYGDEESNFETKFSLPCKLNW